MLDETFWKEIKSQYIHMLGYDDAPSVRVQCIQCLYEVMKQIGVQDSQSSFQSTLANIIKDSNSMTQAVFIQSLDKIVDFLYAPNQPLQKSQYLSDFIAQIFKFIEG